MPQKNLIELAQEGNPKAIAALLNHNLQKHNITAKVDIKGDQLKVLFEADQVPAQERMYSFMQKGMESLKPETIAKVNLYGKAFDQDLHEWEQSFEIQKSVDVQSSSQMEVFNEIRNIAKAHTVSSEVEYESPFLQTQKISNQEISNSAYCPNCGSSHLQLRRDTNVSWGRAAVGLALFGAIGGAVGAVTGEDRNSNACLNCGTSWKAQDLYNILKIIKKTTKIEIDLSKGRDRSFLQAFMEVIGSYLEEVVSIDKKSGREVSKIKSKDSDNAAKGCGWGCALSIIIVFTIAEAASSGWIFLLLIVLPILGVVIGIKLDEKNRPKLEQSIASIQEEKEEEKDTLERKIQIKINEFMEQHQYMY